MSERLTAVVHPAVVGVSKVTVMIIWAAAVGMSLAVVVEDLEAVVVVNYDETFGIGGVGAAVEGGGGEGKLDRGEKVQF